MLALLVESLVPASPRYTRPRSRALLYQTSSPHSCPLSPSLSSPPNTKHLVFCLLPFHTNPHINSSPLSVSYLGSELHQNCIVPSKLHTHHISDSPTGSLPSPRLWLIAALISVSSVSLYQYIMGSLPAIQSNHLFSHSHNAEPSAPRRCHSHLAFAAKLEVRHFAGLLFQSQRHPCYQRRSSSLDTSAG